MNLATLTGSSAWNNEDELATLLEQWSDAYYNTGNSPASDAVFDAARARMEVLNPNHPIMAKVGAKVNVDGMERHKIPMGSLDKLNTEQDLLDWWKKVKPDEVVVQFKFDGLSLGLEYDKGDLGRGLTRGDGIYGENQTKNIKNMYNNDQLISVGNKFSGSARGEGVIFKNDFNEKNFPGESNPRNSSVGAIRKENSPRVKWVRFICYDLINGIQFKTEERKLEYIKNLGLPVCDYWVFTNPEDLQKFYQATEEGREAIQFAIDGLVIKINDIERQKALGEHKGRPKWAMAYKFPFMTGKTKLINIILTVGHTGAIIPTAEYEPITIDGRVFQHALLDNFDTVERLELAIGDEIEIEITGDVIPKIRRVIAKGGQKAFKRPTKCPVCGAHTKVEGAATKCNGINCSAKQIAAINNWVTKVGIKYFGESRQQLCFEKGIVKTAGDLYRLLNDGQRREAFDEIVGEGNAKIMIDEISKYLVVPLNIFMGSLGIAFLGRSNASKLIAAGIDTLYRFRNLDPKKTKVAGFKDNLVEIVNGIKASESLIDDLLDAGVKVHEVCEVKTPAAGTKSFCFTGVRLGDMKAAFEAKGWVEKGSVSKGLDYLVAKDPNSGSSKNQKAHELGTKVISLDEFKEMLNG